MCTHIFNQSSKTDVSYCTKCGILSYKGTPSLSIFSLVKNSFQFDPLLLKFKSSKFSIDYTNQYSKIYLSNRINGINFIKNQAKYFSFPKNIIYKAINYLDLIYLNNNVPIILLEKISLICLLFSIEFNTCCTKYSIINLLEFKIYLKKFIHNLNEMEIFCLKCLDYNLEKNTVFDYIDLFFSLGFIFLPKKENFDISFIYINCINFLEIIIEDNNNFHFSNYTIALSIIKIITKYYNLFENEIFQKIYGINFNKEKFVKCEELLNLILCNFYITSKIESIVNKTYVNYLIFKDFEIQKCKNNPLVYVNESWDMFRFLVYLEKGNFLY